MKTQHWVILGIVIAILLYIGTCGGGFGNGSELSTEENNVADNDSSSMEADTFLGPQYTENELAQLRVDELIQERLDDADNQKGNVKEMLARFRLGMTKRQVKKHMLRMKQKNYLVRVQKAENLYEYVYQLKLESGKSNTFMDFFYDRRGGVYKAVCHPTKFRKMSKSEFMDEVKEELEEWYGDPVAVITDQEGCGRYIWITGTQHLDLRCTSKVVEFVYTDLTVEVPPAIIKVDPIKKDSSIVM